MHILPTLLRHMRAVMHNPPAPLTSIAGPAGSEVHHKQPAGCVTVTGMVDRSAAYPRRSHGARSWERPGACWQWDGGKLRMRTIEAFARENIITVVPTGAGLAREHGRQAWRALAPMAAGRSPFKNLFARNHA